MERSFVRTGLPAVVRITVVLGAILLVFFSAVSCREQKTVVILGDSYSTFDGYVPEGFAIWYDSNPKEENDVTAVQQTWWYKLCRKEGLKLLGNNSYSGSTVCNTGYDGADYSDRSFITRMPQTLGYSAERPNIILIFGGTNDSWSDAPLGSLKFADWTEEDLKQALPAYCYMLNYYKLYAPESRVINIVNDGLKPEIYRLRFEMLHKIALVGQQILFVELPVCFFKIAHRPNIRTDGILRKV